MQPNTPGWAYETYVKDKEAEAIIQSADTGHLDVSEYLKIAAQVRSQAILISALQKASTDSSTTAQKIVNLTKVLAVVGALQVVAMSWDHLVYFFKHGF